MSDQIPSLGDRQQRHLIIRVNSGNHRDTSFLVVLDSTTDGFGSLFGPCQQFGTAILHFVSSTLIIRCRGYCDTRHRFLVMVSLTFSLLIYGLHLNVRHLNAI
jgi:hypothetical protein